MSAQVERKSIPDSVIFAVIARLLRFPYPQVCIHLVAGDLLSILEQHGGTDHLPKETLTNLARAIVTSNDFDALDILNSLPESSQTQEIQNGAIA